VADASPTIRQRELGSRLRRLRTGLGLTVEEVADKLLCSATKVSRIETAMRKPTLRDVRDLCRLYGLGSAETDELMTLARQAREPGWWTQYDDLKLEPYIGLEQDAASITCFMMYHAPALLQTADYARAIIKGIAPKIDPKILDQRIEARLRRQNLLNRPDAPRYRAILDEAVLHRKVGGSAVMQAQLEKILEVGRNGAAIVQIVPFDAGAHASQDSSFVFLEFDAPVLSPVVFVEGLVRNSYHDHSNEVDRYREAIEHLRDSALTPRDSALRIEEMLKSYAGKG
jgi:transcriptional regulator with XRE-family HTH domain